MYSFTHIKASVKSSDLELYNKVMTNNPQINAALSISSSVVRRYLYRFSLLFSLLLLVSWIISVTLTFVHSTWWLLVAFAILPLLVIAGIIAATSLFIANRLEPHPLSRSEKKKIKSFVDEFGVKAVAAKGVKKNPVALSGIIAWKYVKGRGKQPVTGIIMEPVNDVKSLKNQFNEITKLFE